MKMQFSSVSEPGLPGEKWQKIFNTHWPAYKIWLESKGTANFPDLKTSQVALKKYMPKMWPTYKRLCKLAKADDLAARFLTGFQPPAYISACSQAVITGEEIQLVRNYDYHPDLSEGLQLMSAWNGKKVIATSDCLIGAVDGMNEDGLAVSLTFGGRKEVGIGFGIPFILRYVLEFCSNTEEAVAALVQIPSHMSYNVTVVDKTGSFKTVRIAPDRAPVVTNDAFATNHQEIVDWPENAAFNKTLERSAFLEKMLENKGIKAETVASAFLKSPLYNTKFSQSFGTIFTAVYFPKDGTVQLRWPQDYIMQNFDDFQEEKRVIDFNQPAVSAKNYRKDEVASGSFSKYSEPKKQNTGGDWQEILTEVLVNAMAQATPSADKKELKNLKKNLINNGQFSWETVANYWAGSGSGYWGK